MNYFNFQEALAAAGYNNNDGSYNFKNDVGVEVSELLNAKGFAFESITKRDKTWTVATMGDINIYYRNEDGKTPRTFTMMKTSSKRARQY